MFEGVYSILFQTDEAVAIGDVKAPERYEVKIFTGLNSDAGTTANVFFNLIGDRCESGVISLGDPYKTMLPRGSELTCALHTNNCFGNLVYLRIWHDNTGKHPSWFLTSVVVKELVASVGNDSEEWIFDVHDWLAVEYGDGKVQIRQANFLFVSRVVPNRFTHFSFCKNLFIRSGDLLSLYLSHIPFSMLGHPKQRVHLE